MSPTPVPGKGRQLLTTRIGGNPLQYSCLENSMDRGDQQATVHGVAKSQTRLSDFTLLLFFSIGEERTDFSALWDFLAVQRLRTHLPVQGTWVSPLVADARGQLSPCTITTDCVLCSPCETTTKAQELQSLCSATREAIAMRSLHTATTEQPPSPLQRKSMCINESPVQPKINYLKKNLCAKSYETTSVYRVFPSPVP